ncbi:unnamed protein product, partial [Prorocentrum cordatum]
EAAWRRQKYFELQKELDKKEAQWRAEDKDAAVSEAVMQKELDMKTTLLEEAKAKLQELQDLQVRWDAAVGRRDSSVAALHAAIEEHEREAREAAEARKEFLEKKRKEREEWNQGWRNNRQKK